jgi:hypothetical protein
MDHSDPDADRKEAAQAEFKAVMWSLVWGGIPAAIIIVSTKALIARFPNVDVAILLLATAIPVIAVMYAIIFWKKKRHAQAP